MMNVLVCKLSGAVKRPMFDPVFQILFLGENPSWLKLSQAIAEAPKTALKVHRKQSVSDVNRALAAGRWDALAIDLHAWSFQGLHCVQKIRSEFRALPIIALLYPNVKDLDAKALEAGATRCLTMDHLSADALRGAVLSSISEKHSQVYLRKGSQMALAFAARKDSSFPASKMEVISLALNNLLCVISANADVLADRLPGSDPAVRSVTEIKKAARSAADLMRELK